MLAILGLILEHIWDPGGRWGPLLGPPKKQTPKKLPAAFTLGSFWGRFGVHFGAIIGQFLFFFFGPRFWKRFGTHFG